MRTIAVKSYAKINICLDIKGKKDDGYHLLDMVMIPIELHDTILLNEIKDVQDNYFQMDDFTQGIKDHNIVVLSLNKLAELYNFNNKFNIYIHKVIPMQAGLGGGSSNAAFVLTSVNKYLKLNASDEELINISKSLGADIPFFVKCLPSRCQGIGEELTPITIKNDYFVLLVCPKEGCSTRKVFSLADSINLKVGNVDDVVKALEIGDDELLEKSMFNVLEEPASTLVPEIKTIKNLLIEKGLKIVQMSGSGSVVFGLSKDKRLIKRIAKELEDDYRVIVTKVRK